MFTAVITEVLLEK